MQNCFSMMATRNSLTGATAREQVIALAILPLDPVVMTDIHESSMNGTCLAMHPLDTLDRLPVSGFTPRPTSPTATLPSARVLLAEDYRQLAKLMECTLTQAGYEVTVVHDGRAAIDKLRTEPINLAILDIDLPELSGFDVCCFLRGQPQLQHLPVIICSGRGGADDHARARELRASAFVSKPFVFAEFLQSIREVLALT
jgi:CheY-like chemotaxis protein